MKGHKTSIDAYFIITKSQMSQYLFKVLIIILINDIHWSIVVSLQTPCFVNRFISEPAVIGQLFKQKFGMSTLLKIQRQTDRENGPFGSLMEKGQVHLHSGTSLT